MLNDHELELWKRRLGINQAGSDLIDRIRTSEPARAARGWREGNVCGRYSSNKMSHTIQFESHTCELPFIVSRCEFPPNDDVTEYWDQPIKLRLRYKNKNGRMVTANNTPDFFLMHSKEAGFVECKLEENLVKLAQDQPNKFVLDPDGTWRCPPGEEEAAKYGLYYRVFSSAEIDRKLFRNILFLEDFLRANVPVPSEASRNSILKTVRSKEGLTLSSLLDLSAEFGEPSDTVYQLIACGFLYVNLSTEVLIDRDRVHVFSTKEISGYAALPILPKASFIELKIGEMIQWGNDTFEISSLDDQNAWLIGGGDHHPKVPRKHLEQLVIRGDVSQVASEKKDSSDLTWKELLDGGKPEAIKELTGATKL